MRPRFSPLWLAPLGFWLVPMRSGGDLRLIVTAAVLYAGIAVWASLGRPDGKKPVAVGVL
jgi:hypothetical protein